ncbi:pyruvate carboxylase [Hymenobacter lutimineralis]|uniref:Pyruvate carboxylase n=1 Tax=Hymenobacter lutimineralis TaxID=2606448 RepID=A0A5D6V5L1_9BACT|nr:MULTISPECIES: pyruvate carboxylase [Hymenobacter]QIX62995.1 pyruvate carboxylase [Hymenobacter sp. BT18]TYZ10485.1 pyruvate carboxylase [Hymenobacter lutimineralis]
MNIRKLLVANRGEIAIRVLRAATELGIPTVAIYTYEDRYSLHRYKADEAYQVGRDDEPLKPYLDIEGLIRTAKENGVNAIHPGYGFLSENATLARRCREEGIIFIGPRPEVMEALGDKVAAKRVAVECQVPIIESSQQDLTSFDVALEEAHRIGYPVMLKAASGGGGRGMRVIRDDDQLEKGFFEARNEALKAFGDDTVFLEKFVEQPKHIEVQLVADNYGGLMHLYERDCSVQRRYQKVVEVAPSLNLPDHMRHLLYEYALRLGRAVNYNNVGTVEFLVNPEQDRIYFIEVNPRIQVEHTVTEMITGVDLIKTQLYIAAGYRLSDPEIGLGTDAKPLKTGYAIQCRITTEDPEQDFKPDYGTITAYRSAGGFGIRLDQGSVYTGVKVSPFFDSLLVKVSAHAPTLASAAQKMARTLDEFRVRGVSTNIQFLQNIIAHPVFMAGEANVDFIKDHQELFKFKTRQDRATKVLSFLGNVIVNGNPDVKGLVDPKRELRKPHLPECGPGPAQPGTKDKLTELGPEKFAQWLRAEKQIHYTDTTLRDAHQSLLATRMRTYDMLKVAERYAIQHPQTFSLECWGGATFDVALRFLHEDPWERLAKLRKAVPNILLQMLIRGANGVGYKAYPDNLTERFVQQAAETGIDVFRIFDSLNWMPGMEACIGFVRNKTDRLAEASICYTGDILDPRRNKKYNLEYYLRLARQIEDAGAHILCIKDMAGLLKPYAATELITALRDTVQLPIHLHTHDTSSLQPATYLKAVEAGVDVIDVAMGSLSGLTSQPNFNSVVEMLRGQERHREFDQQSLNEFSNYWETVREYYYPFESGLKAGTSEVFQHEIPGGQYSNLRPQASALGLLDKFETVKTTFADVNQLFGDIVKVTPSSKVVGDMALFLVSNNLTTQDVLEKGATLNFPESVRELFRGDIGQPEGGWPRDVQQVILKEETPFTDRPNEHLAPIDFDAEWQRFEKKFGQRGKFTDVLSWLLYPKVFEQYWAHVQQYGEVSVVPTPVFYYGLQPGDETIIDIARGKSIIVGLQSIGPVNEDGCRTIFFTLNGQTRNLEIRDTSVEVKRIQNPKADKANPRQVGAPLQGMLSRVLVEKGQAVRKNTPLFIIEAMKMETTITATQDSTVQAVNLTEGALVNADDLVLTLA